MSNLATTDGDEPSRIDEIVQAFLDELRRGLQPDVEEYCRRYPELADELRPVLSVTITLELARPKPEVVETARPNSPPPWERLGDFRLIREAGRGGMGVVYEAIQESLSRRVAIKTLATEIAHSHTQLERFQREARAVASLHHTNIVPVFAVGEDRGIHFYAMPFINGTGLDQVIDELRAFAKHPKSDIHARLRGPLVNARRLNTSTVLGTPATPVTPNSDDSLETRSDLTIAYADSDYSQSEVTQIADSANLSNESRGYWYRIARIGLQVADALAYAHGQGILHRDIKPSNLLLDFDGTVWVTDFGLAKVAESEDLTRTGEMVGTLRYLAPERLKGSHDVRGDIYGLGLTLYELLTLRKPFAVTHKAELTREILQTELERPRQVDARIPLDLETIVLRSIAKAPEDRYQTHEAMSEDLRLFLDDRPIKSRRVSMFERSWRWCRRNPAVASLTACVATLAMATIAILLLSNAQIRREAHEKVKALKEKTDALHELQEANRQQQASEQLAESRYYAAQVNLAGQAYYRGEITRAEDLLESVAREEQQKTDFCGFEWFYLREIVQRGLQTTLHHPKQEVTSLHFSPDGNRLIIAGGSKFSGFWRLYDLVQRKIIFEDMSQGTTINGCAFSPDGTQIAVGRGSGELMILAASNGEVVHSTDTGVLIRSLNWSPDGKFIAFGGERGELCFFRIPTYELRINKAHRGPVICVFFSLDGTRLYSSADWGEEGSVSRQWDSTQWPPVETKRYTGFYLTDESPDGTALVGLGLGTVKLINARSGSEWLSKNVAVGPMVTAKYSLDGDSIYVAARTDRTVRQLDSATLEVISSRAQNHSLCDLCLEKNGRYLAAGDARGDVRIWQSNPTQLQVDIPVVTAERLFLSTDVKEPIIAGRAEASTWSWKENQFKPWKPLIGLRALSADGNTAACLRRSRANRVEVYRRDFAEPLFIELTSPLYANCVAISKSGKRLAVRAENHDIMIYDLTSLEPQVVNCFKGTCHQLAFSPDEKYLVGSLQYGGVCVFDMISGAQRSNYAEFDSWWSWGMGIAFSADGFYVAAGNESGTVRVWETESQKLVATMTGQPGEIRSLAFFPDGKRLASGGASDVRIWDFQCGQELLSLPTNGSVESLAINPTGDTIYAVIRGGQLKAWSY